MGNLRKKRRFVALLWAMAIGAGASLVALLLGEAGLFRVWELKTYDLRMQATVPSRPAPKNVVMFYVDEDSLRFMEGNGIRWPWPRELYASALDFCRRGGARAVLFDLFFSEDSVYGVDDDATFAAGVAEGPPSYFVLFLSRAEGTGDPREAAVLAKSAVPIEGPLPSWLEAGNSLQSLPIEPLVAAAAGFGNAQLPPDEDGVYRRIPLIARLKETPLPSIPLKVASDVAPGGIALPAHGKSMGFAGEGVPLDLDGLMMIRYYGGTDTFPNYPLARVLAADAAIVAGSPPDLDPAIVEDKVVIIGVAAPGLYDLKPTPLSRVYPGPEVHASVIENLLTHDVMRPLPLWAYITITAASGLAAAIGLAFISSSWGIGVWIVALAGTLIGSSFLFFWRGAWVPIVMPTGAIALASFGTVLKNYLTEGRKKREIRRAFGQYLSPHIVSRIAADPDALSLGGIEQEVTLFFSDIADFTTISEATAPPALVAELNEYFSKTTRIIQEHDGTLDKYIGDAIMAFWGAPLPIADHAGQSIRAALAIQAALVGGAFTTRIGIHTGAAVVGNIGSDVRFNYTAIGDTVNLASRLEGLNKKFGTRIIASEPSVRLAAGAIETRRIGKVRVKGRTEPIGIFEPLGTAGDFGRLGQEACEAFGRALALFEAGRFDEAGAIFARLAEAPGDEASRMYREFCERYQREPQEDFDGVITFTSK